MKNRQSHKFTNSQMINATALFFSLFFLASAVAAAFYTGEFGSVFYDWYLIMISPCPGKRYAERRSLRHGLHGFYACTSRGIPCKYPGRIFFGCGTLLLWAEFFKYVALLSGTLSLPALKAAEL